jgi:hypothetical protein
MPFKDKTKQNEYMQRYRLAKKVSSMTGDEVKSEMQKALSNLRNFFKEECDKCHNFFPRLRGYQAVGCPFCNNAYLLFGSYMGEPWTKEDEESYRRKLKEVKT